MAGNTSALVVHPCISPPVVHIPSECPCTLRLGILGRYARWLQRRCRPTELCSASKLKPLPIPDGTRAIYVTVLHYDPRHVKPHYRKKPHLVLKAQSERLVTLWINLQSVRALLPLHVLLSGPRVPRTAEMELMERAGVTFHEMHQHHLPMWADPLHKASFAKLACMNVSYQLRSKVIFLDSDQLVLRNIDHLANVEAPAFVFRTDRELLNSGLMVLQVTSQQELDAFWHAFARGAARLRRPWVPCGGDGGDQQFWIKYMASQTYGNPVIHELPTSYNAYAWQVNLSSMDDCRSVHVLHKMTRLHRYRLTKQCSGYFLAQRASLTRAGSQPRARDDAHM